MSSPKETTSPINTPAVGYYDRQPANLNWMKKLFNPGVAMQAPEFNELQSMQIYQFATLANKLFPDGTYLTGGAVSVVFNNPGYTVTIAAGKMYAFGFIHDIPQKTIAITGSGTETVQMVIQDVILTGDPDLTVPGYTVTYDSALVDPVEGSENEGYVGAEVLTFAYSLELNTPADGPTIATFDDGQLVITTPTLSLAQLLALLETYFYETLGSFVAVEPVLTFSDEAALSTNPTNVSLDIAGGTGYVKGIRYTNTDATLEVLRPMTGTLQNNEPHTFNTGTKLYTVFQAPILSVSAITGLRQSGTLSITKGTGLSLDSTPSQYHPISEIVSVVQGSTTYISGTDYNQSGNGIQWLSGGARPVNGTTYSVVVKYIYTFVKGVRTLTTISSETATVSGSTLNLVNSDLQSFTQIKRTSDNHIYVLGTDYTINITTGILTWLITPTGGTGVTISYAYWAHTTEGDFVSRDSFVNGSSVVQYFITPTKTPSGLTVDYTQQISFDTTSGNLPLNTTFMFFNYSFTVGRIDYLAWHNDGTLRILQGTPSQNPVPPSFTANDAPVSVITLPAECVASQITSTPYGNLAVKETTLNTFENRLDTLDGEVTLINSNITTLFAGIPYFTIDISSSDSPYTISNLYATYMIDASGGNVVINLPQLVSGFRANLVFIRKDNSTHTVTINPYSAQTIFGAANYKLNAQWQGVTFYPDPAATNWASPDGAPAKSFNLRLFTSGTSYTPTAGTKQILVLAVGGGGGGSGVDGVTDQGETGGGGGGASMALALLNTSGLTFPATITVGTGGTAGPATSGESANTSGGNGSNSQFTTSEIGSAITGYGAEGGINAYTISANITPQGGRGGGALQSAATSGTITDSLSNTFKYLNIYGNPGQNATSGAFGNGSTGGSSPLGGGGIGGWIYESGSLLGPYAAQQGGIGSGGGGSGFSNAGAKAGAAGEPGAVIVLEFIGN